LDNPIAFVLHSIERSGAKVVDVDFNDIIIKALKPAEELGLRILDLFPLVVHTEIHAEIFATFNKNFINRLEDIHRALEVRIVSKQLFKLFGKDLED
jgi:hypothetical protein